MEKLLLTVEEAAEVLCISRSRVFRLIQRGELNSIKIGSVRRVPVASAQQYVDEQLAAVTEGAA